MTNVFQLFAEDAVDLAMGLPKLALYIGANRIFKVLKNEIFACRSISWKIRPEKSESIEVIYCVRRHMILGKVKSLSLKDVCKSFFVCSTFLERLSLQAE